MPSIALTRMITISITTKISKLITITTITNPSTIPSNNLYKIHNHYHNTTIASKPNPTIISIHPSPYPSHHQLQPSSPPQVHATNTQTKISMITFPILNITISNHQKIKPSSINSLILKYYNYNHSIKVDLVPLTH